MNKYEYLKMINKEMVINLLPSRLPESNKGDFGRLFCICGSKEMPGAACFAVRAATKCGVGIIEAVIPEDIYNIVASNIPEALIFPYKDEENIEDIILEKSKKSTAILIGPGMGWNEKTKKIVFNMIKKCTSPMIIDADGINVISENIDILKDARSEIILTPHPKEMSRLNKEKIEEIVLKKAEYARKFAKKYGVTLVIKGHETVISDKEGVIYVNNTGNESMAKGGSGDVLSGVIGAFLAQGVSPIDAGIISVYVHGLAGDICKKEFSSFSVTPTDLINNLYRVFLKLKN